MTGIANHLSSPKFTASSGRRKEKNLKDEQRPSNESKGSNTRSNKFTVHHGVSGIGLGHGT